MNYKTQLSLLGSAFTTVVGTYILYKYTIFYGNTPLIVFILSFFSRYWSQSH